MVTGQSKYETSDNIIFKILGSSKKQSMKSWENKNLAHLLMSNEHGNLNVDLIFFNHRFVEYT